MTQHHTKGQGASGLARSLNACRLYHPPKKLIKENTSFQGENNKERNPVADNISKTIWVIKNVVLKKKNPKQEYTYQNKPTTCKNFFVHKNRRTLSH